jgi:hypothetical protein
MIKQLFELEKPIEANTISTNISFINSIEYIIKDTGIIREYASRIVSRNCYTIQNCRWLSSYSINSNLLHFIFKRNLKCDLSKSKIIDYISKRNFESLFELCDRKQNNHNLKELKIIQSQFK